ncbi:FAD-binding and (Fe-S)-binding domain-containing protein [uncultured Dokdonia sp.]|uniref:FAD-binding and (Fe-S)-binding domain-containing protein n=1 Tax=uncultured Dokdonia sp. TaxID=575653 RepID=UPI00262791E4|nr:FAD-binding and (Fe-S)-binding domain-containing protein [uncultured Dokdonia sp.]
MLMSFEQLSRQLSGELHTDALHKRMYATDASVYRKVPQAVAYPEDTSDIRHLVLFASKNNITLIPRTAGTSLAGQCVGDGIIVDVSKHFTKIIDLDREKRQVTVQPGVIRDELNAYLKPHGLFFGPNTSTANRCMIGGMVGNNSSGTTSIKYGVTRDKVVQLKTVLSDGSEVVFESLSDIRFREKCQLSTLEGSIYKTLQEALSSPEIQDQIRSEFPKPEIHRRNTGYAIDELIHQQPFTAEGDALNLCSLLAGSEGTLAFTTEITLQLDVLPPEHGVLVAAHFKTLSECLKAVSLTMQHDLYTCEMMDKVILDCTKNNRTQAKNRFFIEGDPAAILTLEVRDTTIEKARAQANKLVEAISTSGLSYAYPILEGKQIDQAMELRKAGLGLLGNIIGDRKAVACIEDTAVALEDLASYIDEFTAIMDAYKQEAVYYAHAGAGELHLRPILNLKEAEDVTLFRKITTDVAKLVKSYKGSMSGEHGDGIVRSEFIEYMIGAQNYELLKKIKYTFDPQSIFNKGKIVDPLPMDASLRYEVDRTEPEIKTLFNFSDQEGILRSAEKCNGSGDCRKLPSAGGTMCPSYRATRNEKDTTRARANVLREFLTTSEKTNPFDHEELKEVFDLCVSCKACASECPSNVDVATLKAEFEYQYQKSHTISLRTKLFTNTTKVNRLAADVHWLYNGLLPVFSKLIKSVFKIAPQRSLPKLDLFAFSIFKPSLIVNYAKKIKEQEREVLLFIDEFTEYLDGSIGRDALSLLLALGYKVHTTSKLESGRAHISKGFLDQAKGIATRAVARLKDKVSENVVCVGIEPSAILTFRDEYLRLVDDIEGAKHLAKYSYTIEEFLHQEIKLGNITSEQFSAEAKKIKIHAHCHQKALSSVEHTFAILNLPNNYTPTIIPSGCCGMAGSFGYEKEHYDISMQMGEQTLFPAIRKASEDVIIAANGTSCRHQIKDGTQRIALHPVTILKQALLVE